VARAWTVARLGAALGCGLLLASPLAGCGGTKTVTKTVTVVGTVPNGGATSVGASVAAGAHDFTQFACAQCHGERGRGGVSTDVPALNVIGKQLTVTQLKKIINHGLGESANPKKPYMPVWGQVISAHKRRSSRCRTGAGSFPTRNYGARRLYQDAEKRLVALGRTRSFCSLSVLGEAIVLTPQLVLIGAHTYLRRAGVRTRDRSRSARASDAPPGADQASRPAARRR
jgi:cytochrome c553